MDLFSGMGMDIRAKLRELKKVADSEGLPFGERTMTYNSRSAQELGKWAETMGRGEAFHIAAFRAYFANGDNIADPNVLLSICKDAGLDEHAARKALDDRPCRKDVDEDWNDAKRLQIAAIPAMVADRIKLIGAHPYEAMERFALKAGAVPAVQR